LCVHYQKLLKQFVLNPQASILLSAEEIRATKLK